MVTELYCLTACMEPGVGAHKGTQQEQAHAGRSGSGGSLDLIGRGSGGSEGGAAEGGRPVRKQTL